ncbi:MAG TPA: hypothetical protein VFG14_05745 [Chthoniobacteraceae bacterium]|nr:hypothetical protein [Chthoniobacteraceae bacterium]
MNGRTIFAALVVVLFCIVVWFADPMDLILFGVVPLVWVGVPAAIIASVLLLVANRTGRSRRLGLTIFSVVGASTCLVGLAVLSNHFVQEWAVSEAKAFPARIAPYLEEYRRAHGAYPKTLDQLPAKPPLPRLMRGFGYHSDGQSYSFMFPQPGGFIDCWNYDSETQTWELST